MRGVKGAAEVCGFGDKRILCPRVVGYTRGATGAAAYWGPFDNTNNGSVGEERLC